MVKIILMFWRYVFPLLLYLTCDSTTKTAINRDLQRLCKWSLPGKKQRGFLYKFTYSLLNDVPYRNTFYYRVKKKKILCGISKLFIKPSLTIEIDVVEIGAGLLLSHNYMVIAAEKIGNNFRCGPGVVIGRKIGIPTIGNNVYIATNSIVIGRITIGDNVIIGAGSVVMKDLPGNSVYVGNPARFVCHIDDNPKYLEEIT